MVNVLVLYLLFNWRVPFTFLLFLILFLHLNPIPILFIYLFIYFTYVYRGKGITMDHGTGCVVGETAVIGDNVYLMHGVTLGATGRDDDHHNRHPKIGRGAFLAANSTILGNITIGDGAVVGASSLVIKDVPAGGYTAVGIPARLIPPPSSHSTRNQKLRVAPSGTKMPASEYSYDFGGDGSNNGGNSDGDGDGDGGDHYNKGGHGMGI